RVPRAMALRPSPPSTDSSYQYQLCAWLILLSVFAVQWRPWPPEEDRPAGGQWHCLMRQCVVVGMRRVLVWYAVVPIRIVPPPAGRATECRPSYWQTHQRFYPFRVESIPYLMGEVGCLSSLDATRFVIRCLRSAPQCLTCECSRHGSTGLLRERQRGILPILSSWCGPRVMHRSRQLP